MEELMEFFYTFFIAFILIFVSELGDKTQLIVLSFCNKLKASSILLGVALGTFFSHGLAILFGSYLSLINEQYRIYLSYFSYVLFILFGCFGFFKIYLNKKGVESKFTRFLRNFDGFGNVFKNKVLSFNYIFIIAFSIFVGELGDKTFLASLGLGIQYPFYRFSLVLGSIVGMVCSNSVAILFGKFISKYIKQKYIDIVSNIIFIIFGVIGFLI